MATVQHALHAKKSSYHSHLTEKIFLYFREKPYFCIFKSKLFSNLSKYIILA